MAGDSNNAQEQRASTSCVIVNKPALHEQEKLLYMSICLLYHIAEDLQIEKKMRKFNLVECLCEVLHRTNTCLLIITVAFLRRLSVYIENLNGMRDNAIVFKLLHILRCEDETLLCGTLRLLCNLSFDRGFREDMVDCGFLHCFEDLLQKRKFEHLVQVWNILCNLSRDFDLRLKLSESKLISILVEPLLVEHEVNVPQELSALLINLTCIPKTAVLTIEVLEFEKFVTFVLRTNDMLLFKVVKNLSFLEGTGAQLIPFVPALVTSLLQCEPCIQIIMFIGGVCSHRIATTISQAGLVENLSNFFADRCDDVDIVLQSLYAMSRFMLFESTREAFLQQPFEKVMDRILRLSQDSEKAIVTMVNVVIDGVCHFDDEKRDLIRKMRFDMYNSGWSEAF